MLDAVLSSCQYVAQQSKRVSINPENLKQVIKELEIEKHSHWLQNAPFGLLEMNTSEIIDLLLIYHAIGFSYWGDPKWTIHTESGPLDGAFALLYTFVQNKQELLDFKKLQNLTLEKFHHLTDGNIAMPLVEERHHHLLTVAEVVTNQMQGSFSSHVQNIRQDTKLFALLINHFKIFDDVAYYKSKPIYFYKLAQLLTSDVLHVLEMKEQEKVDYTHLKGCADYKIPQVLRELGVLTYDEILSNIVDSKQEIPAGSEYEVEIRANMIMAIHLLKEVSKTLSCPIEINDAIWSKGQEKKKTLRPYHLTRTTYY